MDASKPSGGENPRQTTNDSIELLRLLRGFAIVTRSNISRSWLYSRLESRPRNIFATNVPPRDKTCAVMLRAAKRS